MDLRFALDDEEAGRSSFDMCLGVILDDSSQEAVVVVAAVCFFELRWLDLLCPSVVSLSAFSFATDFVGDGDAFAVEIGVPVDFLFFGF